MLGAADEDMLPLCAELRAAKTESLILAELPLEVMCEEPGPVGFSSILSRRRICSLRLSFISRLDISVVGVINGLLDPIGRLKCGGWEPPDAGPGVMGLRFTGIMLYRRKRRCVNYRKRYG